MRGRGGNDKFRVDAGEGDDSVVIYGGYDNDNVTYDVSAGKDNVWIYGGRGEDRLTVNAGLQSFTIYNWWGKIIYKQGEGGTKITVITVEHITVIGPEGEILFEWP